MGRETYTYKINEEKIRTTLFQALQNKEDFSISFSEYLVSESNTFKANFRDVSVMMEFDYIIKCFQDVESLPSVEHLAIAFDWIWEVNCLSDTGLEEEVYGKYGFEQIYEVGAKDRCWVYLNQMSEFSYHADMEDEVASYEGHYLHTNKVYKYSISYLITLLSLLCLEKSEDANYYGIHNIEEFKKNTLIPFHMAIAEKELVYIRENNEEAKKKEEEAKKKEEYYRRTPDESHHIVAEQLLYEMLDIRKQIMDYDGWIFIYDCY